MILSDFLSRQKHNDSSPHEIIPISFNRHNVLHEKYFNIGKSERYLVQTQSQTKSSRVKLLEVHSVSKTKNRKWKSGIKKKEASHKSIYCLIS